MMSLPHGVTIIQWQKKKAVVQQRYFYTFMERQLWGNTLKRAIIYIHGKGGSYLETEQYKKNCLGFDIIGIDYNDYLPWIVQNQFL